MTYDVQRDPGDENDAPPPPRKVCLMCYGQGVLYSRYSDRLVSQFCPTCKGTGKQ